MTLFEKTYDGESLYDLSRDVFEAFEKQLNPKIAEIPQDEYGFQKGTFKVTIEWKPEDALDQCCNPTQTIPEGWQIVPIEPTEEMCRKGVRDTGQRLGMDQVYSLYQTMLAAAPAGPRPADYKPEDVK